MIYGRPKPNWIASKNWGYFLSFGKTWFLKHQKTLLWFLNHPVLKYWFRWVLRIHKDLGMSEKIYEIAPHYYSVIVGKKGKKYVLKTDFRTHPKFAKRIYFAFEPLWWLLHYWDVLFANNFAPKLNLGFDVLTVYPDPNVEITTVDGYVQEFDSAGLPWATIHDNPGDSFGDADLTQSLWTVSADANVDKFDRIRRSIFLFDTSTANAPVFKAWFSVKVDGVTYNLTADPTTNVYSSAPASNTALAAGDYDSLGTTGFSTDRKITALGYNMFILNSTGLAAVDVAGVTKLGVRNADNDTANSAPAWVSAVLNSPSINYADQVGLTQDPKLEVFHTKLMRDFISVGGGIIPAPR